MYLVANDQNKKNKQPMITKDSKNILLADDSVFFRTQLSAIIAEAGHNITFSSNGEEVIEQIKKAPDGISLLILDLQMPRVDGFAVLEWMKEHGHEGKYPVLCITGAYEPSEILTRLQGLGANGLMTKGFTPEQVVYRINQLLFPDKVERVKDERTPLSIAVDYTIEGEKNTGFILNLSPSGLFLHTRLDLDTGTTLDLKFSLPGTEKILEVKGIVQWGTHGSEKKKLFGGS